MTPMVLVNQIEVNEMEYYITKYALTKGIYKVEGEEKYKDYLTVKGYMGLLKVDEYFETKKEAITQANRLKEKKIKSLEKQLEKMKGKWFVLSDLIK